MCLHKVSLFANVEEMSHNEESKASITATIEGNAIDIIYVGVLEIHTVLTCYCATIVCGPACCILSCVWFLRQ